MALQFEWDKEKAESNFAKHGVSFDLAKDVFRDEFAIERIDQISDPTKERFIIIGMAGGYVLYVAYAERNEGIRLISARQATRREKDDYFRQAV